MDIENNLTIGLKDQKVGLRNQNFGLRNLIYFEKIKNFAF